jgi:GAF domain-containing protein
VAARHERLAVTGSPKLRALHANLADLHRGIEQRHLTAASLHGMHAERLVRWAAGAGPRATRPPRFMATVAETLDARAVGLCLLGSDRTEKAVVASNRVATAAQELEFTFGEGPAHDAATSRGLVLVTADTLPARWAHYSPAVARLGVRAVDAAPMFVNEVCFGVLTVFDPPGAGVDARARTLCRITDALVHTELLGQGEPDLDENSLLAGSDHRAVAHQAAGMITEQLGCSVADALAVLRARAFVENESADLVARRVLGRQLTFD